MEKLFIIKESNPMNPREWDNIGTIAYKHKNYNLGDEKISEPIEWLEEKLGLFSKGEYTDERLSELESKFFEKYIVLPLYLYDHSGITIRTTPFNCRWDSGKIGYIYISKEKVREEYNWKVITQKRKELLLSYLKYEVKEFDQYLTGDVYKFKIEDEKGEEVDSCGGFFGRDWEKNGIKDHINEKLWPQLKDIKIAYEEEYY